MELDLKIFLDKMVTTIEELDSIVDPFIRNQVKKIFKKIFSGDVVKKEDREKKFNFRNKSLDFIIKLLKSTGKLTPEIVNKYLSPEQLIKYRLPERFILSHLNIQHFNYIVNPRKITVLFNSGISRHAIKNFRKNHSKLFIMSNEELKKIREKRIKKPLRQFIKEVYHFDKKHLWQEKYLTKSSFAKYPPIFNGIGFQDYIYSQKRYQLNLKNNKLIFNSNLYYFKDLKNTFGNFKNIYYFHLLENKFLLEKKNNHPINTKKNIEKTFGYLFSALKKEYLSKEQNSCANLLKAYLKFNPHCLKVLTQEKNIKHQIMLKKSKIRKQIIQSQQKRVIPFKHTRSLYLYRLMSGRGLEKLKLKYLDKYLLTKLSLIELPPGKLNKHQSNVIRNQEYKFYKKYYK